MSRFKFSLLGIFTFLVILSITIYAQVSALYGTTVTSLSTGLTTAVTGTTFSLPADTKTITWAVVADGSALSAALQASLDNVTFFTVDTTVVATGELKNYGPTGVKFVRINAVSRTGGTATTGTLIISRR